jgi:hypothetical protein
LRITPEFLFPAGHVHDVLRMPIAKNNLKLIRGTP